MKHVAGRMSAREHSFGGYVAKKKRGTKNNGAAREVAERWVVDHRDSSHSASAYYAREAERRDWAESARPYVALENALARSLAELNRQRDAWRLFEAQRYGVSGVKLDPVLWGHLR